MLDQVNSVVFLKFVSVILTGEWGLFLKPSPEGVLIDFIERGEEGVKNGEKY